MSGTTTGGARTQAKWASEAMDRELGRPWKAGTDRFYRQDGTLARTVMLKARQANAVMFTPPELQALFWRAAGENRFPNIIDRFEHDA